MSEETQLSKEKSLEIIQQMIQKAKTNFTDDGYGWLLWGSMIFIASVATYFLADAKASNLFLAWNIFGGLAIILLTYGFLKPKRTSAKSYISDILRYVDIGFTICLFIIILSMNIAVRPNQSAVSPNAGFGLLLMLYGFLMIIQAGATKFKPLIIGAIVNWLGAIAIFVNTDFKYDMLITAAAVFIGYIIPGLILRAQFKKERASRGTNNPYHADGI